MGSAGPVSLNCGIIGAGIAGLAAAIALRRAGHEVELFEKSSFKNEVGAALSISPNGNAVLDRWGFDAKRAAETDKQQSRSLDSKSLTLISQVDLEHVRSVFGHSFNAFHRVDMHTQLREMALEAGASIRLGKEVTDVDCERGIMGFKDDSSVQKDLVVIADGIRSSFVRTVSGVDSQVRNMGRSIFRTLIPMERLMKDPVVRPVFENQRSGFCTSLHPTDSGVFFITYPCRNNQALNVAVFHTTRPGHENDVGWNSPATKEEALSVLGGMNPFFAAIVSQADDMKCFPVLTRPEIPRYYNGRTVLVGDAAHPMQPTHAQGAGISLEDAGALEILFKDWDPAHDKVERRTKLFSELRLPRGNTTQLVSNAMFYNESMEDGVDRIRRYYSGKLPPARPEHWGKPIQDFFYPYDVFEQAQKALAYKDAAELPESAIEHFYSQPSQA